jgi:PKD repeat protein/uncharacterized protein YkwD
MKKMLGLTALAVVILSSALFAAEQPVVRHEQPGEPLAIVGPSATAAPRAVVESRAPTTLYDHGDPTAKEQLLLEMVNRARANPTAEGIRLAETNDADVKSAYAYYSTDTNKLKTDFAGYAVRQPLAFNANLIVAARRHSNDMAAKDFQDHTGSDGSTLSQRVADANYTGWNALAENIYAYSKSMWYAHCGFNVDWGVPDLGHRKNIMNYTGSVYNEIGIGVVAETDGGTKVGPWVVTQDFGLRSSYKFLVGVVYEDKDGDGFYSEGEGLSGVTVTPESGTHYAITSTSGGYAFPISGTSGTLNVTFSGGGLSAPEIKTVALTGGNAKQDVVVSGGGGSAPTITSGPSATPSAPTVGQTVTFSVTAANADSYAWNFGDGSTGTGSSATHAYSSAGTYSVSVTVVGAGGTTSGTLNVTVSSSGGGDDGGDDAGGDGSHTVNASVSTTEGNYPLTVTFSASGTDGSGAPIVDFAWVFGDGTTGSGASVSHTYDSPGIYVIYLTATDSSNNWSRKTTIIVVGGAEGAGSAPPSDTELWPLTLNLRMNFAKPGKDNLKFTGELELPSGFNPVALSGSFNISQVVANFTFDAKGKGLAVSGKNKITLRYKRPRCGSDGTCYSRIQVSLSGDFSDEFAWDGATNKTAEGKLTGIPLNLVLGGQTYSGSLDAYYTAKYNKNGRLTAKYKYD